MNKTSSLRLFKKSLAIAFFDSMKNSPPTISLIFPNLTQGTKSYNYLKTNLPKEEISMVLKPISEDKLNVTFKDKYNFFEYNINNISFQELNYLGFTENNTIKNVQFLTMFLSKDKLMITSDCETPLLINEVIFEN